ncbi:MAG: transcriptional repressor [Flavobacteriaceae bacterium]
MELVTVQIKKSTLDNGSQELIINEINDYINNNNKPVDRLTYYLVHKGFRKTPERYKLLEAITKKQGQFNSIELFNEMEQTYRLSLATIYNCINIYLDCGIIKRVNETNQLFKTTYFETVK